MLLHGLLGSARNLATLARRLVDRNPELALVALDLTGHGGSGPLPPGADTAALAADVYDAARVEGTHELWRSMPIPPGPLLCRGGDGVPCEAIAGWLLEAHARDPAVMAALRAGWPEFGEATAFAPAPPVPVAMAISGKRPAARGAPRMAVMGASSHASIAASATPLEERKPR